MCLTDEQMSFISCAVIGLVSSSIIFCIIPHDSPSKELLVNDESNSDRKQAVAAVPTHTALLEALSTHADLWFLWISGAFSYFLVVCLGEWLGR